MNIDNLEKILNEEPKFRIKQAQKAIFKQLIECWDELTVFPLELRKKLDKKCSLLIKADFFESQDKNTVKAVIVLIDGLKIESVLMRHKDGRNTVCVSSQVGCPLACQFCATGKLGFKRNLSFWEIIEQTLFFNRYLKKMDEKVTNVVFMGMGEPFLNYENVLAAIKILNNKDLFNIGARRISISTAGVIEGIKKLSKENLQINLAVSLHASNNELRSKIMPINKKYPLEIVFEAIDLYIKKTKRKVMFEYLLIKDINDSEKCAKELSRLMKKPLYFLNLILYNTTGVFKRSSPEKIRKFKEILKKEEIQFVQRYRFGGELEGACGQLVFKENDN
jgi:23S rRNA (adenine2503-C2)-methyltransferase